MFRLIRFSFKLATVVAIVALVFNFKYDGKSSREYAQDWGEKILQFSIRKYHELKGKELGEIIPSLESKPKAETPASSHPQVKSP